MRICSNPTPETLEKVRLSKSAVEGIKPKDIRCPYCGRLLTRKYPDTRGHIDGKCDKCGRQMVIDLVSWRRKRR